MINAICKVSLKLENSCHVGVFSLNLFAKNQVFLKAPKEFLKGWQPPHLYHLPSTCEQDTHEGGESKLIHAIAPILSETGKTPDVHLVHNKSFKCDQSLGTSCHVLTKATGNPLVTMGNIFTDHLLRSPPLQSVLNRVARMIPSKWNSNYDTLLTKTLQWLCIHSYTWPRFDDSLQTWLIRSLISFWYSLLACSPFLAHSTLTTLTSFYLNTLNTVPQAFAFAAPLNGGLLLHITPRLAI